MLQNLIVENVYTVSSVFKLIQTEVTVKKFDGQCSQRKRVSVYGFMLVCTFQNFHYSGGP